jgi:hypothetical protein
LPKSAPASPDAAARFVEKWSGVELSERAASQEHFLDLCRLLDHPISAEPIPRRLHLLPLE